MKIIGNAFSVVLVLVGCVWFLQGIGVLPGSFMTGQTRWAVYGGGAIAIGAGALILANRRGGAPKPER